MHMYSTHTCMYRRYMCTCTVLIPACTGGTCAHVQHSYLHVQEVHVHMYSTHTCMYRYMCTCTALIPACTGTCALCCVLECACTFGVVHMSISFGSDNHYTLIRQRARSASHAVKTHTVHSFLICFPITPLH